MLTRDERGLKTGESATGLFPNPASERRAFSAYDAADRLVSAKVVAGSSTLEELYRYDGCGALTNVSWAGGGVSRSYAYDPAGRMVSAATSNGTFTITYDAVGNRARTTAGGVARLWVTDHADALKRPLMETDANGAPVRWYVWGGGRLLAVVEADGVVRYAHSDEQGSVVALTDAAGTVTDQFCYGPYGTDWGRSGTNSIPFRWLGSHGVLAAASLFPASGSSPQTLPSSLYLTRHRAYDAALGRFLSADPLGLGGGPNVYAYCLGNPLAYIDPLGLCAEASGWEKAWNAAWVGDFSRQDNGWAGIGAQTGVGLVPIVGQLADLRDTIANVMEVWHNPGVGDSWAGLGTAAVAWVPGFGDAAKGLMRGGRKLAGEATQRAAKSATEFSIHPRVLGQLESPRLGDLAGKLKPVDLQRLLNERDALRVMDLRPDNFGNINVIQDVEGKLLRITVPNDAFKVISVGPIRQNQVNNLLESGAFQRLP